MTGSASFSSRLTLALAVLLLAYAAFVGLLDRHVAAESDPKGSPVPRRASSAPAPQSITDAPRSVPSGQRHAERQHRAGGAEKDEFAAHPLVAVANRRNDCRRIAGTVEGDLVLVLPLVAVHDTGCPA
ncbi:MAG TPA: hypothetical protein DCY47_04025 [Candidatus Accumulibacter sp.]|nr:hypothetical protein [Accumulibacter sp.]